MIAATSSASSKVPSEAEAARSAEVAVKEARSRC